MNGPDILVRSLSENARKDRYGNTWQYMSRSDHHSKVACWAIVFDLLIHCPLLRRHVDSESVFFGINHEFRDFRHDRKKKLDLVLCTSQDMMRKPVRSTLAEMIKDYGVVLTDEQRAQLDRLPVLRAAPVGSVLMALEAKACMTAHQKALPRLYDELNSSHQTVHGATEQAIAAGFVMVNASSHYLSPDRNKGIRPTNPTWSRHKQPRDAGLVINKVRQIPRRSTTSGQGYDALAIVVLRCANDGSNVDLVESTPAPQPGDIYNYSSMISRLSHIYTTRFKDL